MESFSLSIRRKTGYGRNLDKVRGRRLSCKKEDGSATRQVLKKQEEEDLDILDLGN